MYIAQVNKSTKRVVFNQLKGVNFCGVLFCGFFILRELIFADRGQSAKYAKIKTRKIFMLHDIYATICYLFQLSIFRWGFGWPICQEKPCKINKLTKTCTFMLDFSLVFSSHGSWESTASCTLLSDLQGIFTTRCSVVSWKHPCCSSIPIPREESSIGSPRTQNQWTKCFQKT